jgi:rRNA maturation protein Rpf1
VDVMPEKYFKIINFKMISKFEEAKNKQLNELRKLIQDNINEQFSKEVASLKNNQQKS